MDHSNILNQPSHGSNHIVLQLPHMDHRFSPNLLPHSSSGNSSRQCIRINIKPGAPWALDRKTPFLMPSDSCQALPILLTPRVNTQFLEVSIDMHSTQRLSRLSQEMVACQSLRLCHIMGPLITDRLTTAPLISLTTPTLLLSNNLETEWGITWQGRAQITLCLRIMHPLTWLKDP